jgi:Domain of unknown function (DUF4326)
MRTKGWRKPPGAVLVTRPGRFGNPFEVKDYGQAGAVTKFRHTLFSDDAAAVLGILGFTRDTVRRDQVCWCAPEAYHGDVLLAMSLAADLIRCQALRGSLWPAG